MAQQQPSSSSRTLYEILELEPTAPAQDIKKAYRKLALKHHPDRNPPEDKERSTILFRHVNEAYEVLIDPEQRRHYDEDLQRGTQQGRPSSPHRRYQQQQQPYRRRAHRDPFAQFNDLFQNDPFFHEAFREMDDLFAQTFQQQHPYAAGANSNNRQVQPQAKKKKQSWGAWIADCLGIDLQVTSSRTTIGRDGQPRTSYTSSSYAGSNNRNRNNRHSSTSSSSTYTSKSTRTVIENGQRVTIQSLEKDGNKIEEKYINNQLVQRLINGIPEQQYKISEGDL